MVSLTGIVKNVVIRGHLYYAEIEFPYKDKKLSMVIELPSKKIFDEYSLKLQAGKSLISKIEYNIREEKRPRK